MTTYTLTISCGDRPGIVMNVTQVIYNFQGNILEAQQFDDQETGQFFMRVVFKTDVEDSDLKDALHALSVKYDMQLNLYDNSIKKKVLLLVSKFDHCLGDLLYRARIGELNMDVVGVISNHPQEAMNISLLGDVTFHHFPITKSTKAEQEEKIKCVVEETGAELVVLARYMQILSDDMCRYLSGRCINIHHSFLPGFKGAKPYHQAYDRGVKMIGATSHYVTSDLDEGPIIHQDVEAISHSDRPDDLVRKGRNIEQRVLSRAVLYHLENRILLNGSKTVVFKD